jgi:FkbM family methyltransferase
MNDIKDNVRKLLARANVAFTRKSTFDRLIRSEQQLLRHQSFLSFAQGLNSEFVKSALQLLPASKGEIFQDLFAALCIGPDKPGFFVEFGATDGVNGSNTWLLEKELGWKGILAEPGRGWHVSLAGNRNCTIETDCVWIATGQELEFTQANDAGFSTISSYAGKDRHSRHRENGRTYLVNTVSLHDMLTKANAPSAIDYISIDTEGSEFDILSHFPFGNWDISILTIEHNFREERGGIHDLLTANGFVRVLTEQSQFDDWYVAARHLPRVQAIFTTATYP